MASESLPRPTLTEIGSYFRGSAKWEAPYFQVSCIYATRAVFGGGVWDVVLGLFTSGRRGCDALE